MVSRDFDALSRRKCLISPSRSVLQVKTKEQCRRTTTSNPQPKVMIPGRQSNHTTATSQNIQKRLNFIPPAIPSSLVFIRPPRQGNLDPPYPSHLHPSANQRPPPRHGKKKVPSVLFILPRVSSLAEVTFWIDAKYLYPMSPRVSCRTCSTQTFFQRSIPASGEERSPSLYETVSCSGIKGNSVDSIQ